MHVCLVYIVASLCFLCVVSYMYICVLCVVSRSGVSIFLVACFARVCTRHLGSCMSDSCMCESFCEIHARISTYSHTSAQKRTRAYIYVYIHNQTYIYTYIYSQWCRAVEKEQNGQIQASNSRSTHGTSATGIAGMRTCRRRHTT
jgi:hypothetical protein